MTTTATTSNIPQQEFQGIRDLRLLRWTDSRLEKLPTSFCRFAEEHLVEGRSSTTTEMACKAETVVSITSLADRGNVAREDCDRFTQQW